MSKKKPHMKKKEPQPPINVDVDIDYDKLADAIVKAQEKAEENKEVRSEPRERTTFFQAVWRILKGEKSRDGRFLSAPFVSLISLLYRMIAVVGTIVLIRFDSFCITNIFCGNWAGLNAFQNIAWLFFVIVLSLMVVVYMIIFWGAANDVEGEKDKNYIASVFSGLVSFVALIVSLVALYKGVS